jgi:hypothetical protein
VTCCKSILEANIRQRCAPPGAFWLWTLLGLFGHWARTHYLSGTIRVPGKRKKNV